MQWVQVLLSHWRFVIFGLIFTMSSSLGQTFFISLFIPSITQDYSLTTTNFANYYALITLGSASLLPVIGRLIDKVDLLTYAAGVCLVMALACAGIYLDFGAVGLITSILLIRLCGQGLMSHIALTSLARYFVTQRGRVLAFVTMGHPLAESFLPILTLALIQSWGWQSTYFFYGAFIIGILYPLAFFLVRKESSFRKVARSPTEQGPQETPLSKKAARKNKLSFLTKIFAILPSFVCVPMLATAYIFHQSTLAKHFDLEFEIFAQGFMFFALFQIMCTFISGTLIDRFGAIKTYPIHLLALIVTLLFINTIDSALDVYIYMAMLGSSAGLGGTTKTALVAEIISPENLGRAKSFATSAMVFSTALGPAILSNSLDLGLDLNIFNYLSAAFCLSSLILALTSFRKMGPVSSS